MPTSGAKGRVNYIQPTFLERERRLFLSKMSILFPEAGKVGAGKAETKVSATCGEISCTSPRLT